MTLPFKTRKDCPRFKGWAAIDWFSEQIKYGDRYVEIKPRKSEEIRYPSPDEGYNLGGSYSGTCSDNWNTEVMARAAAYRPIPKGYTDDYIPCGQLPLP